MSKKMLVLILGTLFATAASAADLFATLDTDQNGAISKDEASALPSLVEQWSALDTDASGDLSSEEFAVYQAAGTSSLDSAPMRDAPKASSK